MKIADYFSQRKYPGRVIIAGNTNDKKPVLAYAIMGRSENSRNRVFSFTEDGCLKTSAYDEEKLENPENIIYTAMKQCGKYVVLTNGNQTDLICHTIENGGTFQEAVMQMSYESDEPNYTSRIAALFDEENNTYNLAIARKEGGGCTRIIYTYPLQAGYGHCIHTYLESDGDLLPPFTKDPERFEMDGTLEELANELWYSLDEENRISLFVQVGDEMTILNKNNGD